MTHVLTSAKLDATGQRWASALGEYNFDILCRAGHKNGDADASGDHICIKDKTVKAICASIDLHFVETLPSASINVIDATESPGQPMAQIELRELRRSQREDPVIGKWTRAVMDRKLPQRNPVYSKSNVIMKKNFDHFKIVRGVLYRETQDNLTKDTVRQLFLPAVYRDSALKGLHTEVGHPGKERTLSLIRERFFWPGITADKEEFLGSCNRCLRRKSLTNSRAPLSSIGTTFPIELVCMDFLTVDPCKGGIGNILVVTDHFTKYALAIPTRNQTAKTTAEAFYENFIINYSVPVRIHSDQGRNFE